MGFVHDISLLCYAIDEFCGPFTANMSMLFLLGLLGSASALSHSQAHAVVPLSMARELVSRWRPSVVKVHESIYFYNSETILRFTAAAIAMRGDKTFCVCGDVGDGLNMYVIQDHGHMHEVCAILWSPGVDVNHEANLCLLMRWHVTHFALPLRMGNIHPEDARAWTKILRLDDDADFPHS